MCKLSYLKKGTCLLLALTFSLMLASHLNFIMPASTQTGTPRITIIPSHIEVGDPNKKVNLTQTTDPFMITINVSNVVDLFAWQVHIDYYPLVVNCTSARYPEGHVFYGKDFQELPVAVDFVNFSFRCIGNPGALEDPVGTAWSGQREGETGTQLNQNLTKWVDRDNSQSLSPRDLVLVESHLYYIQRVWIEGNDARMIASYGYVKYGATLLGTETTFSGNGTLCQIEFVGTGVDESILNFTKADTYLLNSALDHMSFDVNNATVTVKGIRQKETSTISLNASPKSVKVGGNVTLAGAISPSKSNVTVTIKYREDGEWNTLATAETDAAGIFEHVWVTNKTGTFKLKASWEGDEFTEGAESDEIEVTVTEEEPQPRDEGFDPTLYIAVGAVVAILVVAVVVYFKKFRG